ncbi:hypothetical protein OGAPHI_002838 [Ogataea philodendri]|uniref:Uncharacterized protein n=1 Tax=Ogataea philodendri TaxID=1378263 RepID=A0A9P8T6A9_9ASCO|nr:uncharacterized protein OGAPHI_002838 [Ogataea philodendri]KAH3667189.1 hypothetical protein OGAPHI_002838 [Ogataea philodendri]
MFMSSKSGAAAVDTSSEPQVIDFNTVELSNVTASVSSAKKPRSWFWPFGGSKSAAKTEPVVDPATVANKEKEFKMVGDSTNKVIAMKKMHEGDDLDDDFIDIQVRKLSYAEVAALQLKKNSLPPAGSAKTASSGGSNLESVVDQDLDLEKSVTDVEFAENYRKSKKFTATETHKDDAGEEEQLFDDYSKKVPKRFTKNGKYLKKRDT